MSRYIEKQFQVLLLVLAATVGCSIKKETSSTPSVVSEQNNGSLIINSEDWFSSVQVSQSVRNHIRILKNEKIEALRRSFHVPVLRQVNSISDNGYEIYRIDGIPAWENKVFIHPKLFVASSVQHGSLFGYKIENTDSNTTDTVISVPVALLNGLANNIPISGSSDSRSAVIDVPASLRFNNLQSIRENLNSNSLDTLPVCPTRIYLVYQGRKYLGSNPFDGLSVCPINQMFRVEFRLPTAEMSRILEAAALNSSQVSMQADLVVPFAIPTKIVESEIDRNALVSQIESDLRQTMSRLTRTAIRMRNTVSDPRVRDTDGYIPNPNNPIGVFTEVEIDWIVLNAIHQIIRQSGETPRYSHELNSYMNEIKHSLFSDPIISRQGELCRFYHDQQRPRYFLGYHYSWVESEPLAQTIRTRAVSDLGVLANSSRFRVDPARYMMMRDDHWDPAANEQYPELSGLLPSYFRSRTRQEVQHICSHGSSRFVIDGGHQLTPEQELEIDEFCVGTTDGYTSFGSNTIVYPGAWLKIEIDDIQEFTSAKTRVLPNGSQIVESQVIDLLANAALTSRTTCTEGARTACESFRKKRVPVLDRMGSPVTLNTPCTRGEPNCSCTTQDNNQVCQRTEPQIQEVLDYQCAAEDVIEYCPYYRTEEQIIDREIEWDCQVVTRDSGINIGNGIFSPLLSLRNSSELKCEKKSEKPIRVSRQILNCVEDDPQHGIARRVRECRRPKYICDRWTTSCNRYSVNESYRINHEEPSRRWRSFNIDAGEYPRRFEDQIYLKFVSPTGVLSNCRLDRFRRVANGRTIFIKIPDLNDTVNPCQGRLDFWATLGTDNNLLPKVHISNRISYFEQRLCGATEYNYTTREIPLGDTTADLVPLQFSTATSVNIGPVQDSCTHESRFRLGNDMWFRENPPVRFSGRVSVLGRILDSVTDQGSVR